MAHRRRIATPRSTAGPRPAGSPPRSRWSPRGAHRRLGGPTPSAYEFGIRGFDSLWYHLPWPRHSRRRGHITWPRSTDVEYLTAFYPPRRAVHGLGIVLLGRDTLSPGMTLIWLGVLLLAATASAPRGLATRLCWRGRRDGESPMTLSREGRRRRRRGRVSFSPPSRWSGRGRARSGRSALGGVAAGLAVGTSSTCSDRCWP